jgi:hypothetical protein
VISYEIIISLKGIRKSSTGHGVQDILPVKIWYLPVYVIIGIALPLFVRQYMIMQPLMIAFLSEFYYNIRTTIPTAAIALFILPALLMIIYSVVRVSVKHKNMLFILGTIFSLALCYLGFKSFANFKAEEIMKYDYLVRSGRWNDVVRFASGKPPRNYLSLSMLNLSLAKTGQLGNKMFSYVQRGENGLFLPFNKEYVAPLMGGEILYNIGFINAAQEYAFESMETIPNLGKSARIVKRLAETNLINGQYKVAEKYLNLLEKTIFYRKWARTTSLFLNNEEKINSSPDWGEKRRFAITKDYFFSLKNIEASLAMMVKDHPDNKIAFEYLMAFYLINKDLRNFLNLVPVMERMNYREIPASYQEAMMYVLGLNNKDPMTNSPSYISQTTKARMKAYADIYTNYRDAGTRLKKNFSNTYWYYLHFTELVKSDKDEKK